MGKIFVLIGKSSSGKDTIYKQILNEKKLNLKDIVLYTTRPIRSGEAEGIEYHFVSEDELRSFELKKEIVEKRTYHTVYGDWTYFMVDDGQIDLAKNNYLLVGTLESFVSLRTYYGEENVLPVYIDLDDGIRLSRALEREKKQEVPKYAEMCRRYLADHEDFSKQKLEEAGIQHVFINNELNACLQDISEYIQKQG